MICRRILLGFSLLSGCGGGPELPEIQDHPTMISATVESRVTLDAVLPSDLLAAPGGEVWVLDGYAGRALRIAPDGSVSATIGDPERWGHPLRLGSGGEGHLWLSDPAGRLLQIDESGGVTRQLAAPALDATNPSSGPSAPVALLELAALSRRELDRWRDEGGAPDVRQNGKLVLLPDAAAPAGPPSYRLSVASTCPW